VSGTIDRIGRDHPGRRLVVVAHFGAILAQLTAIGLAPQDALQHKIDTLSITELARNGPEWHILRINHTVE
jgi:broad specificity phosphatase PhoE